MGDDVEKLTLCRQVMSLYRRNHDHHHDSIMNHDNHRQIPDPC